MFPYRVEQQFLGHVDRAADHYFVWSEKIDDIGDRDAHVSPDVADNLGTFSIAFGCEPVDEFGRERLTVIDLRLQRLARALEVAPDSFTAYVNRGLARKNLNELPAAEADLTRAIALQPERGEAYYHRGLIRLRAGDLDGVRADAVRATALLGPDHPLTPRAVQLRDDPQSRAH